MGHLTPGIDTGLHLTLETLSMTRTEFAILGAGALGSILAAHLAAAGHDVVVLARGERARNINEQGLRIKGLARISVRVPVIMDPSELQAAEILIVATKTPGTQAALERLGHVEVGVAFSVQNGVLKDELLAQVFGGAHVLGAVADTSGELLPSGEVLFTRNVNLPLGELTGDTGRATCIAGLIDDTGIRSRAVADIVAREWSKFTAWVPLMSLAVVTRLPTWRYLSDCDCALVLVRVTREMAWLAAALEVTLREEGILFPLGTVVKAEEKVAVEAVRAAGDRLRLDAPDHRMSSLQDLESGRTLEFEETVGDAVRRASQLHRALPLLEALYHLIAEFPD
jgi:2-dehydropantoate 2-reductase